MKNIKFNYSKYCSKVGEKNLFNYIEQHDGSTLIQRKPIKDIEPRLQFFDFEIEVGDVYLLHESKYSEDCYPMKAPENWPVNVAWVKFEPGTYHAIITNVYNGYIFYRIQEIEESIENCLDIRNGFPTNWIFDKKDLPKNVYDTID